MSEANAPGAEDDEFPARLYAPPEKRSLTLLGHRSSVSLEPAFWTAFRRIAARRGQALNALAAEIDGQRPQDVGLACALRTFVLHEALAGRISELDEQPVE